MPFHAMSRVEVTPVVGPWLPKNVIKPENPHGNGQGSSVPSRKKVKIKENTATKDFGGSSYEEKVRNRDRPKFCGPHLNRHTMRIKMNPLSRSTWIYLPCIADRSPFGRGSGYCTNVADRFPFDRGKWISLF